MEKGEATHSSILAGEFQELYSPWDHKELDMTNILSLFMESRKIVLMNPSAEQQQRHRCRELVDTGVGEEMACIERVALKHIYYHIKN